MRRALLGSTVALALVAGGCAVEVADDDFGSVGAGVASGGGITPQCSGTPVEIHAKLARNGETLRVDGTDGASAFDLDPIEVDGVYHVTPGGFSLDACGVNPCAEAELYDVTLDLAGEVLEVPDGAFARLSYTTADDGSFAVVLTNLADITGVPNPVDQVAHPWLQVMQGLDADAPFSAALSLKAICENGGPGFQGHDLIVSVSGSPSLSISVTLDAPADWVLDGSPLAGRYRIRDIASFSEGETALAALLLTWKGPL